MKQNAYTVGASAVLIVPTQQFSRTVQIYAKSGDIHLGDSTVTTTDGLRIANGGTLAVTVPNNETLYAIAGAGGTTVVVLDVSAD